MKIYAFHLLNDYSGSPKVLMQLLKGWQKKGLDVTVVTCSGRDGFLSNIEGIKYKYFWYRWSANPIIRLVNFIISQFLLLINMIFKVNKSDIIYVNTILPFGAALLGKIKGCRIIYHVHETTMKPAILKKFLFAILRVTSDDVIYVSNDLAKKEFVNTARVHVMYNAIETGFLEKALANRKGNTEIRNNILMVCSLKDYKGIYEYEILARLHQKYSFVLVLNAKQAEINQYFNPDKIPHNLKIYSTQTDLHPFYANADLIVNLSRPDGWIETFGLTIIEGMSYGLPAIVPHVGGIAELVKEGYNGFKANSRNLHEVSEKLKLIMDNKLTYEMLSNNAAFKINMFREDGFIDQNMNILECKKHNEEMRVLNYAYVE